MECQQPEEGNFDSLNLAREARCRVILWDESHHIPQKISTIIQSAGAEPVLIKDNSDLQVVQCCPECTVAVLVTVQGADQDRMQVIRDLKTRGFKVIACGEGAGSWPIRCKCLALLAGAVQLLDSASSDFSSSLQQLVERILRAEMQKRSEEQEIAAIMRRLGMVAKSAAMLRVFRAALRFSALSDLPVLITGETGTGKEGLARAVHFLDPKRGRGPFIAVNCGAISAGLAESEFFGHRRGAFTGADRERKGLIRSAEGGVLFLDEIGDLEPGLQTKLLRVLQENRVLGVGEDREAEVSVRVVAASNRDLEQMIRENRFRADLFHRLNVLSIHIPPLRDHSEDLAPLVEHFVHKYQSLAPAPALGVGIDFLEALRQVELPGNIRQLENLVRQALVRKANDLPLSVSDLPVETLLELVGLDEKSQENKPKEVDSIDPQALGTSIGRLLDASGWNLTRSLEICERHALEAAMARTQGNQSQTAKLLGITPRSVYNKLRKYNLKVSY
ncbi:MAG: sigma-54-dependent Fis family transcriptional regulator [Verrucomicrobia bacterium]|nr:sigma-54-dependent Fis family transcriptional regulator [Verrucomicrobiota bacterium]